MHIRADAFVSLDVATRMPYPSYCTHSGFSLSFLAKIRLAENANSVHEKKLPAPSIDQETRAPAGWARSKPMT